MRSKSQEKIQLILNCVSQYYDRNFCAPSLRMIEEMTNISRQTVSRYLKHLAEKGIIDYDGKNIITEQIKETRGSKEKRIAICGNIVCGNPLSEESNTVDYIYLPNEMLGKGSFFALRAYGDSMVDAGIDEGDIVIIRKQEKANVGQIVVVLDEENRNTLKRLLHDGKRYYLHSENNSYENLYPDEIKVQGVAIKVIKNL